MTEETFNGYVTKYALTTGVVATELTWSKEFPDMVSAKKMGCYAVFYGEGRDWHRSLCSAESRLQKMVADKIKSLEENIRKLNEEPIKWIKL